MAILTLSKCFFKFLGSQHSRILPVESRAFDVCEVPDWATQPEEADQCPTGGRRLLGQDKQSRAVTSLRGDP